MKYAAFLWGGMILCVILVVVLLFKIHGLESQVQSLSEPNATALATLARLLEAHAS